MSRLRALLGSAGFLLLGGPMLAAGLVPWLLTRWDADETPTALRVLGAVLIAAGAALVVEPFARFALEGRGTPMPWAPPTRFVARGSYRFTRNPMYVGVVAMIVGQGLLLGREILYAWAAIAAVIFHLFVVLHEEPGLRRRFGAEYEDYCRRVGRWSPRLSRRSP
ncbi:MAG TPA: isoprenylcysteine carboxylmethyltransferase family protein [Gaiellaceae bacterium]|nr:isoprenylcysteine carboxylmethyltransferase family protein [Gaiellaceae bacterium]